MTRNIYWMNKFYLIISAFHFLYSLFFFVKQFFPVNTYDFYSIIYFKCDSLRLFRMNHLKYVRILKAWHIVHFTWNALANLVCSLIFFLHSIYSIVTVVLSNILQKEILFPNLIYFFDLSWCKYKTVWINNTLFKGLKLQICFFIYHGKM